MKLSIALASIIALVAASPVKVRGPKCGKPGVGLGLNQGDLAEDHGHGAGAVSPPPPSGEPNDFAIDHDAGRPGRNETDANLNKEDTNLNKEDADLNEEDFDKVDVNRFHRVVPQPPPSTGPKNKKGFTEQNCRDIIANHGKKFAERFDSLCWGALDIHTEMAEASGCRPLYQALDIAH
ncbi:hypothetical protein E5D57_001386 [Metarhizium anisopliae]|nr:hypothetical protein E5D57_001386 [Metarhizium anisopliae]